MMHMGSSALLRVGVAAVLAGGTVLVAAGTSSAATEFAVHQRGAWAVAHHDLGDGLLSVYASSKTTRVQANGVSQVLGAPTAESGVAVDLSRSSCRDDLGGLIDQWLSGWAPSPVVIAPNLTAASWPAAEVVLQGREYTTPLREGKTCEDLAASEDWSEVLDWEHTVESDLAATVSVTGSMTATGRPMTDNSVARFAVGPRLMLTVHTARARMATTATVTVTAVEDPDELVPATLSPPVFTYIGHDVHRDRTVLRSHVVAPEW
jgi:hypothetical protein